MSVYKRYRLGMRGEEIASKYFVKLGYTIIAKRLRTLYGEIDLVVSNQLHLVFAEVKTVTSPANLFELTEKLLSKRQKQRYINAALHFCTEHSEFNHLIRFDFLLVNSNEVKYHVEAAWDLNALEKD